MFDTFDINDIVHMSKIADHYLGEYEALLNSSEMQASNVSGNFRALNFTDADISGIDYNSDDWANDSVVESSETSGELTNSIGEVPEYTVTAGRKPLSIVIRRCSTPSSASSSPSRRLRTDSSSTQPERCVPSSSKCTDTSTSEFSSLVVRLSCVPEETAEEEVFVNQEVSNEEEGSSLLRDDCNITVESTTSPPADQRNVQEENTVDSQSASNDVPCGVKSNSDSNNSQMSPVKAVSLENPRHHHEHSFNSVQDESNERTLESSCYSPVHVVEESTGEEIGHIKKVACKTEIVPAETVNKERECQIETDPLPVSNGSNSTSVCASNEQNTAELLEQHDSVILGEGSLCSRGDCVKENYSLNSEFKEKVNNEDRVQSNMSVSEFPSKADPEIPDPHTNLSSGYDSVHSKTDEFINPEKERRHEDLQSENNMCATNDKEEDNLDSKFKASYPGENSQKNILDDVELIINADVANTPEKIKNETAPGMKPRMLEEKGYAQKKQSCAALNTPEKTVNQLFGHSPIAHNSETTSMLSLPVPLSGTSFFSQDCLVNRASACIVENFAELPLEGSSAVLDTIKSECNGSLPLDSDNLIDISSVVYGSDMLGNSSCAEYSPLLFSSDDESPSFKDEVKKRIEAALAPSPGYAAVLSHEKTRLSKLQEILIGAPPPPSITMPHHSVAEMLKLLKERDDLMVQAVGGPCTSTLLAVREAASSVWPKAKYCQFHGIHYNHGVVSESYEAQCQKLQERCVGNETASSCTLWSYSSSNTSSKDKRPLRRQTTGASPGRRLSHLAQRQRTFSSSNLLTDRRLQNVLPHCGPERRTIMVNVKKKSARKPRSSQKKKSAEKAERSRNVATAKLNSSKRALFQSPEEEKKKGSSLSKFRVSENRSSEMRSRRALFVDDSGGNEKDVMTPSRKRKREETEENVRKMPRRMLFADSEPSTAGEPHKQTGGRQQLPRNGQKVPEALGKAGSSTEISSYHKKKLLWAVAEALKQKGVGTLHPSFRACAAALASRCRVHVKKLLADRQGSTSDRMFALALEYVGEVMSNIDKKGDKGS